MISALAEWAAASRSSPEHVLPVVIGLVRHPAMAARIIRSTQSSAPSCGGDRFLKQNGITSELFPVLVRPFFA